VLSICQHFFMSHAPIGYGYTEHLSLDMIIRTDTINKFTEYLDT